jgi:hypothetical protein
VRSAERRSSTSGCARWRSGTGPRPLKRSSKRRSVRQDGGSAHSDARASVGDTFKERGQAELGGAGKHARVRSGDAPVPNRATDRCQPCGTPAVTGGRIEPHPLLRLNGHRDSPQTIASKNLICSRWEKRAARH